MRASGRRLQVIVLAALISGCATESTPQGSPAASAVPPSSIPTSTPASPTGSPAVEPVPSPSPTTTPPVESPPAGADAFTTSKPPRPAEAWTGIRWRKLAATDPLAHVRSVTRWRGGFIATGDLVVTGNEARTKVWASADGVTWVPLEADSFGPDAVVVGVAPIAGGVVALTLQIGRYGDEPGRDPSEVSFWSLEEPWQSWTSTDGLRWAAHPGPAFEVPRLAGGSGRPTLLAGAGNDVVALTLGGQPLAFSRDGMAWETASLDAFPGGPAGWKADSIVSFAPGFVSVGSNGKKDLAIASADGRTWTSAPLPARCPRGWESLKVGPAGVILVGQEGDYHSPTEVWCSSLNGRSWRRLPGYAPLAAASECRGVCSTGILEGDGERMIAYRGYPSHAGWTSFDGRSWTPLAISGNRPPGWTGADGDPYSAILTPIGLLLVRFDDGSAWLGTPRS